MKCPVCNGQKHYKNVFGKDRTCQYCLGAGEIEEKKPTNFSRITSSPEALAKWVCEITDFCDRGCSHCPIQKECQYDADGAGNSENEQMLVEWLKEKHEPLKNDEK